MTEYIRSGEVPILFPIDPKKDDWQEYTSPLLELISPVPVHWESDLFTRPIHLRFVMK